MNRALKGHNKSETFEYLSRSFRAQVFVHPVSQGIASLSLGLCLAEVSWSSPKGKCGGFGKEISEELGRKPDSTDLMERNPFDVEIMRIPPGKAACPFHSHSAQWEFYHVIAGKGVARDKDGETRIEAGDAFLFRPGEPHQLINDGTEEDLVIYVVADNPIGESCHYPDSNKWLVRSPERRLMRSEPLDYYDGEE